jgi:S-adenosylmethionine/arginine decarboxylase-like enzyme
MSRLRASSAKGAVIYTYLINILVVNMFDIYDAAIDDAHLVERFKNDKAWGMETIINLHDCNVAKLADKDYIRQFVIELCDFIKMKRYGEPIVERFGEGELYGITAVQLIWTSSIVIHFSEYDGRAFFNVFSCAEYSPAETVKFCADAFEAGRYEFKTLMRA